MNFNLVEMYNGLLRFNKHILNELAEGLKHLPNLDGVSKGDSLIINEQGNPAWGSAAFIPTFENAAYGIEWTKDDNDIIRIGNAKFHRELPNTHNFITEFDFQRGVYFIPNKVGSNKKLIIIGKEVMMGKIQIKLLVCFCLAVALIPVLGLALVAFILIGFGRVLVLMSASLPQLNLIK